MLAPEFRGCHCTPLFNGVKIYILSRFKSYFKYLKLSIEILTVTHGLMHFDLFLFIQNDFLQHVARAIISGMITVICNGNQENDFNELS